MLNAVWVAVIVAAAFSMAAPPKGCHGPLARPYRVPRGIISGLFGLAGARQDRLDPLGPVRVPGLGPVPGGLVVLTVGHGVGGVLLRDDALVVIVRVLVSLPVAQPRRPRVGGVAQMGGYRSREPGPHVLGGGADRPSPTPSSRRSAPPPRTCGPIALT